MWFAGRGTARDHTETTPGLVHDASGTLRVEIFTLTCIPN